MIIYMFELYPENFAFQVLIVVQLCYSHITEKLCCFEKQSFLGYHLHM